MNSEHGNPFNKKSNHRTSNPADATQVSLAQALKSPRSYLHWILLIVIGLGVGLVLFYYQNKNSTLKGSGNSVKNLEQTNEDSEATSLEPNLPSNASDETLAPKSDPSKDEINQQNGNPVHPRAPYREFHMWARETKQGLNQEVREHWNTVSELQKKRNNPEKYLDIVDSLPDSEKNKLMEDLNAFKIEFSRMSTDAERIQLINKYSKQLKLLPAPKRRPEN